jgi:hypothetical protein
MVGPDIMPRLARRSARLRICLGQAFRQIENLPGDPLAGGAATEVERQLIGLNPLLDPRFRQPVEQIWILEQPGADIAPLELSVRHLGDGLDVATG